MKNRDNKDRRKSALLCAGNLKTVLRYRGMSVADLAEDLGMSQRTLEAYTSGRVSLENAQAKTVMVIAEYLRVDPAILIGMKPVDEFFEREKAYEAVEDRLLQAEPWERKKKRKSRFKTESEVLK